MPSRIFEDLKRRFRLARFLRGEGPRNGPTTLDRSRVFVFPTRSGFAFAAVLLVMLLGSVNYSNNPGLALTFVLGSLGVVSILHTYHNLAHLTFRTGRPEPVFAGDAAGFPIGIENRSGRTRRDLRFRLALGGEAMPADVPGGLATVTLSRPSERRGRLPLGRFTVETRFPLSLFRAWSHLEFNVECLVYPRPGRPLPWQPEGEEGGAGSGERGRGQEDFSGLRNYLPGDPPRQIHWKGSARAEALLTKQFSGAARGEIWLDWGDFPTLDCEARLSQLCRCALDAHQAGSTWGLRLPGRVVELDRGADHLHRCLAALATFES